LCIAARTYPRPNQADGHHAKLSVEVILDEDVNFGKPRRDFLVVNLMVPRAGAGATINPENFIFRECCGINLIDELENV
jgi:hypothetical protein